MHEVFLKRAIDIASKGKYLTKPNPNGRMCNSKG